MNPSRLYLISELFLLFVLLPLLYWLEVIPFHKIIPLVGLFAYCVAVLVRNKQLNATHLRLRADWKKIILRFVFTTIVIGTLLICSSSYPLFADLNDNNKLMLMLILYPLFSALPQEVIFREFFFTRYASLFRHPSALLIVNVLLFSFAHIYFSNWIVLAFTLVGGALFAYTFLKTRSLLVVTIEHTLYGVMILSSGLNLHFYKAF